MDGTPIFSMAEAALPATRIAGFRGPLNSTSNYVLSRMAQGESLEEAVAGAQRLGIAEADPSERSGGLGRLGQGDGAGERADGRRSATRRCAPRGTGRRGDAPRAGGAVAGPDAQAGGRGRARRETASTARVRLAALPPSDLLAHLSGMEAALQLRTDTMGDLTLIEGEGGPGQTAFGVLADLVAIARTSAR